MVALPNFEEGQSTYRPPRFNGQYYGWWNTRMHDFIMAEDSELWGVICDSTFVPTKKVGDPAVTVPKTRKVFNDADRKAIEKYFHAKKILVCGIGPDEYNMISACQSAKEIWEALQTAHEGTTQVKQSKIDMLTTEYELFRMKDDEFIQDMHTRFTSIINELHSLGEIIPRNNLVRKILSVLPSSWESKVNAITEAKDLQTLTIDELVGNLKTYEMKKKKDHERREPKRKNNLVLKIDNNESSSEDADMAYLTKRFQKTVRKIEVFRKRAAPARQKALVAWGDSSSESREDDGQGDSSMMAVESEAADLINDKNALTTELGEIEYERDDLVVVAGDLRETIGSLKREKDTLTERIANIEHERDLVVVVDLKETIEELRRENRPVNTKKGKEVASEAHLMLKNE
nr:uncharacterized protein LOC108946727 [Nicotiana tomentosiformis]